MIFHIRNSPGVTEVMCGKNGAAIYRSLSEHMTTEARVSKGVCQWMDGDSVCLDCVRRARPSTPKALRMCQPAFVGDWVVLCGCGGVRPYGKTCGKALTLPAVSLLR